MREGEVEAALLPRARGHGATEPSCGRSVAVKIGETDPTRSIGGELLDLER